jgi:hypothetical protein
MVGFGGEQMQRTAPGESRIGGDTYRQQQDKLDNNSPMGAHVAIFQIARCERPSG